MLPVAIIPWLPPALITTVSISKPFSTTTKFAATGVPAELVQGPQTSGFGVGLSGMRERVNDLGGTFEIQSRGNGTLITVSIPLAPETPDAGTSARKNLAA
jgi:signal transduction histidine kinase